MLRPLIIGITGSIASGKSEVVNQLKESGFKVHSTDQMGHDILLLEEVKNKLTKRFGLEILNQQSNLIDRAKLSAVLFKDRSNLDFINSISHPLIFKRMKEIINISQDKYLFFEVPLLFEAKLEKHFDFIITVSTTPENQLSRLMKRNNLTKDKALQKITSQLANNYKETNSDAVIYNNGDLKELKGKTVELIATLPSISQRNIISF